MLISEKLARNKSEQREDAPSDSVDAQRLARARQPRTPLGHELAASQVQGVRPRLLLRPPLQRNVSRQIRYQEVRHLPLTLPDRDS